MKLREIREISATKKRLYGDILAGITTDQGELLLPFVKDALEYESGRGEHLDTKGNWILGASLAGLAATAAVAKSLINGLSGRDYAIIFAGVLLIILALFLAAIFVLSGIRIRGAWFPPNPELIIRSEILAAEQRYLYRDLILHYTEAFMSNWRVSESKADMLMRGQFSLLLAFGLAVVIGVARIFIG